eukprot:CAMPEP_0201127404 /NCGR_PEP_ID=MMETSP0850-20130426/30250_1 /ASSEMBLY_ACC=CAM_ASM_000622 /TAXON_ID=183588 /ORGANISM="Pseudo-nitzschia fraudulenta, Strain WWA7" /LENGTH=568 /DNA_ID=CAMNT_0047396255 /DNA_START=52 /DNA_END=1755 /DNA_ORIENTATION=-
MARSSSSTSTLTSISTDGNHDDRTERTSLLSVNDFSTRSISTPTASILPSRTSFRNSSFVESLYGSLTTANNTVIRTTTRAVNHGNSSLEEVIESHPEGGTDFVDVEEGSDLEQHRQQQVQEGTADATTAIPNVDAATNSGGTDGTNSGGQRRDPQRPQEAGADEEPRDGAIGHLTRRLRCLFSTITWPIVPLGTIVSLALLWVLYAAASLDLRKSCAHPLHSYSLMSLLLVTYIPNHANIRSHIFNYSRERDGPIRPTRVRMYDQFFHTVCLLYVYTGVTLIQTCREDTVDMNTIDIAKNEISMPTDRPLNACEATCPNLYQALSVYIATLELFTFALILPLLFLPCIYLWFLQRATAEADAFARLQDQLQEEEALLSNGGVTTGEILDSLEVVKIFRRRIGGPKTNKINNKDDKTEPVAEEDLELQEFFILPYTAAWNSNDCKKSDVKECCICMSDFELHDVEETEPDKAQEKEPDTEDEASLENREVEDGATGLEKSCDPRKEGRIDTTDSDLPVTCLTKGSTIIRTRCGHVFHKDCLKGWVGGMWTANITNGDSNNGDDNQHDW